MQSRGPVCMEGLGDCFASDEEVGGVVDGKRPKWNVVRLCGMVLHVWWVGTDRWE